MSQAEPLQEFSELIDLAAERLGGAVILANDEFFAPKEALLRPHPAEWREGEYTDRGKWMDGWETRRRRTAGHDWCIIRLGLPGSIRAFVVDTAFFRGNFPESCSIEATSVEGVPMPGRLLEAGIAWTDLLARSTLEGDAKNIFRIAPSERVTHLRFNIFPDGGVARLRVMGEVLLDWSHAPSGEVDLAAAETGGRVLVASDMFFGNRQNMIMPGRSTHMGDGWETKRRRGPGHDWAIVRLARPGEIHRAELDTDHYKGNSPESAMLEGMSSNDAWASGAVPDGEWTSLLARSPLQPHSRHKWQHELSPLGNLTHVRVSIYPDGGVARLRLFGTPDAVRAPVQPNESRIALSDFNEMHDVSAATLLIDCCASRAWVRGMINKRPFESMQDLKVAASQVWWSLGEKDWKEAFAHHPRIGEKKAVAKQTPTAAKWSSGEQRAVTKAGASMRDELVKLNDEYAKKFGYIYIVRAAGRGADELLSLLKQRLDNAADKELKIAASEQFDITRLRLEKAIA